MAITCIPHKRDSYRHLPPNRLSSYPGLHIHREVCTSDDLWAGVCMELTWTDAPLTLCASHGISGPPEAKGRFES